MVILDCTLTTLIWGNRNNDGNLVTGVFELYDTRTLSNANWETKVEAIAQQDLQDSCNTGLFIRPWNMLENWLMPQFNEDSNEYIFQQDGSPAHYKDAQGYLNRNLPQRWITRTGKEDDALMRWPPRSPDLTPCDFFFWGFVKDTVFVPPLPANLQIFATVSPLLWLWSTVICWHACGTRWLSHRCLPYYQRWAHWASVKYVKILGEFLSL